MNNILVLLIGFALPLLLFPLEVLLPYPHVIEELAKLAIVLTLISWETNKSKTKYSLAVAFGIMFTFSETSFYLMNFWMLGNFELLPLRLVLTGSLHILTTLILYTTFRKHFVLGLLGLVLSIVLHFAFNTHLASRF